MKTRTKLALVFFAVFASITLLLASPFISQLDVFGNQPILGLPVTTNDVKTVFELFAGSASVVSLSYVLMTVKGKSRKK